MQGEDDTGDGYYGSLACAHEVSALSMDCMMVSASDLAQAGGFEPSFSRQFHDLDLCMALRERSLSSVVTPSPRTLSHRSSRLRRSDFDVIDRALFVDRHYEALQAGDPYYNPGFARSAADYSARPDSTDRIGAIVEALR
jgi:GT2 family glycosyltransferase